MCFSRNNEYGQNNKAEYYGIEFGEDTTYNKTAGTANDTAFVVNVVNPSEEKIYSFCYGAGYDREIFTGTVIIPTTGITLDQTSGTLTEGDTVTLTATVSPDNATYKTVTWETSNSSVATVADGVVTALRAGTATITAKTADGNFSATYTLTVEAEAVNYTNLVPTAQEVDSANPYTVTNTHADSWVLVPGFGRLTWQELATEVGKDEESQIIEIENKDGSLSYKKKR